MKMKMEKINRKRRGHEKRAIIQRSPACFLFLLFIALLLTHGCTNIAKSEKKKDASCISCHTAERVLPEGHVPTNGLLLEQCLECHDQDETKLTNKIPLSHTHRLTGISCADCHGEITPPKKIGSKTCGQCHDSNDLASQTKAVPDANPHDSHYGDQLTCDLCHHIHKKSENFCSECHDFQFVVPSPWIPLSINEKS